MVANARWSDWSEEEEDDDDEEETRAAQVGGPWLCYCRSDGRNLMQQGASLGWLRPVLASQAQAARTLCRYSAATGLCVLSTSTTGSQGCCRSRQRRGAGSH